jgi:hypothetical protein
VVLEALPDITEPDERAAAESVLRKMDGMTDAEFDCLFPESEECYV